MHISQEKDLSGTTYKDCPSKSEGESGINPAPDYAQQTLDRPGAGLPALELLLANILVKWRLLFNNRSKAHAYFMKEQQEITQQFANLDARLGCKQVLIKRLAGLEDSSRNWSVYMVLDHLRIVNTGITDIIVNLVNEEVLTEKVSTAAVKPSLVDERVVDLFIKSCDYFLTQTSKLPTLKTRATWAHPWFGELNAASWHFFAGFHMELHRRQIDKILEAHVK